MVIYILKDADPAGGYFAAQDRKPFLWEERSTVVEVREVSDFPEDLWQTVLEGGLPVDEDYSNDSTWAEWWSQGRMIWVR
jgi:hypothetical protein